MVERLLANPRSFAASVATVLGGAAIERPELAGFLNSEFDAFLNHLFAAGPFPACEAPDALEGRPGFIWLPEEPSPSDAAARGAENVSLIVMHGMTAATAEPAAALQFEGEVSEVRSRSDLRAWHGIYCEVLGADTRGIRDWQRVHDALGPAGQRSLSLLLARVNGSPAATGGVYFEPDIAGLYCFATRERMRGRGLASALVHACHAAARARGIEQALLQATASGRPVYARAGYREQQTLPVLRCTLPLPSRR